MGRILHMMLASFYIEGAGYQENLLSRYHKLMGLDVVIITNHNDWAKTPVSCEKRYVNNDGVKVIILPTKPNRFKNKRLNVISNLLRKNYIGLYNCLEEINPEIIFVHGCQSFDNLEVVKYKHRHPEVKIFVDNHSDYYNTPVNTFRQKLISKIVFRYVAKRLYAVCETFWGVTPWRVEYIRDVYGLPEEKTKLLVMGGDDTKIDFTQREAIRRRFRAKYDIGKDKKIVVTGGKIDITKNIHLLIKAVGPIENVRLVVFGKPTDDFKSDYEALLLKYPKVINIGWVDSSQVYDYFLSSDLVVFPGTHSVLWEQAVACGVPMVVKKWDGMQHVNVGGNCKFIDDVTEENIKFQIVEIISDTSLYVTMKNVAENQARRQFLYSNIAKRAIGE